MSNVYKLPNKSQKQLLAEAARVIRQDQLIIENLTKAIVYLKAEIEHALSLSSKGDKFDKLREIEVRCEMVKVYGTTDSKKLSEGSVIQIFNQEFLILENGSFRTMTEVEALKFVEENTTKEKSNLIL